MPDSLPAPPAAKWPRVLYVEDHSALRTVMAECMKLAGYEVETAADGIEGWSKFSASPFDMVVTDLNMPNRDGLGLIQLVRDSRQPTRIIVYSSAINETNRLALRKLAVHATVTKESNWEALRIMMSAMMRSAP